MAWTCSRCTFINPPSHKSTCQICFSTSSSLSSQPSSSSSSPPPSSSAPSAPKWSCKACTFLNPYRSANCEVCGTRASSLSPSILEDDELDPSIGSIFLPLQPCKRKDRELPIDVADDRVESGEFRGAKSANKAVVSSGRVVFG